jgi:hypothetical protein
VTKSVTNIKLIIALAAHVHWHHLGKMRHFFLIIAVAVVGLSGCAKLAGTAADGGGQFAKLFSGADLITNSCKAVSLVIVDEAGKDSSADSSLTVGLTSEKIRFFSDIQCLNEITELDVAQGTASTTIYVVATQSGTLAATITLPTTSSGTNLIFTNTVSTVVKQAGDNMDVTVGLQSTNKIYVKVFNADGSPAVLVPVLFDGEYTRVLALSSAQINIFSQTVITDMTGVAGVIVTAPPVVTTFTVSASVSTLTRTIVSTFNLNSVAPVQP